MFPHSYIPILFLNLSARSITVLLPKILRRKISGLTDSGNRLRSSLLVAMKVLVIHQGDINP
jgi:hypothetical protein